MLGKARRPRYIAKVAKSARVGVISFFLLFSVAPALAKPKDAPISPSVGRDIEIQLVRGGYADLVLEGIAMPRDTVQFEVVNPPRHGSLGQPRRINKDKIAFLYRHDGTNGEEQDRVDFRLKTGPENAWGRIKAKIFISEPKSHLEFEPEALDFGAVPIGGSKALTLRLRNSGGGIITGAAEISPMWTLEGEPAFSLAEGDSRTFLVTFAPIAPEAQNGRIVLKTGQRQESFVLLRGEGEYRFAVPAHVAISRDGENSTGILRVESRSNEPLALRLEAASPVLVPAEVPLLQPRATIEIPLGLEKKNYTANWVRLTVSDGSAKQEVRVNLPPPPAVLEWEQGHVLDIGGIPFRNVPEIEIGLRNAGAGVAFVSLADGVGGLVLAPSQPQSFELAPGATALVRTVWKLPETPGPAEARITALEGGLAHPLDLRVQIEPTPPKDDPAPRPATANPSPTPTPGRSRGILSKAESEELKRRMAKVVSIRLVPEGGAATAIVTWKYRGPQPVRFQLESVMAVREVVDPGKVFEKRIEVPEELPPAPVVAKWLPVKAAAIQQLDNETWEGRVPGLPGGYHPIRIGVRSPPDGKRIDYVEFPVFVGKLPNPSWMNWVLGGLGLLCIFYLLRKKMTRKSQ